MYGYRLMHATALSVQKESSARKAAIALRLLPEHSPIMLGVSSIPWPAAMCRAASACSCRLDPLPDAKSGSLQVQQHNLYSAFIEATCITCNVAGLLCCGLLPRLADAAQKSMQGAEVGSMPISSTYFQLGPSTMICTSFIISQSPKQ